ncbi:MAG: hypothetical protein AAF961_15525, partial [Planctomycetota bacterium]
MTATYFALLSCPLLFGCQPTKLVEPDPVNPLPGPRQVVALGRLEPEDGVIELSAIPGERLQGLGPGVDEGEQVAAGSELGYLASLAMRQKQLDAIDTRLDLAKRQREQERIVARTQVDQAQAGVAQAQAKLEEVRSQERRLESLKEAAAIAAEDVRRLEELRQSDASLVTEHQVRRQRNRAQQAEAEYAAAAASYPPGVAAAESAVNAAEANLKLARQQSEQLEIIDQNKVIEMEREVANQALQESIVRAPKISGGPS